MVEFKEHGMSSLVKCRHRNVCKDGFELEDVADAGEGFLLFYVWKAWAHSIVCSDLFNSIFGSARSLGCYQECESRFEGED